MFNIQHYEAHVGKDSQPMLTVFIVGMILVVVVAPIGIMYYLYRSAEAGNI